jgi:Flp pilus assembly protein TadG
MVKLPTGLMLRLATRLRREEGTALVEFAVVLPLLLLILMGILYFGRYLNYTNDATQLAGSAARWAAVNSNPGAASSVSLQQYVARQATPELANGSSDVSPVKVYIYYPSGSTGAVGQPVRACVTSRVNFIPLLGVSSTTIVETATMSVEDAPGSSSVWTPDSSVPAQCPTN